MFLLGMATNHVAASMHHQSEEERHANGVGKSDSRIVPQKRTDQMREMKLGNSSEGKAAKLSRESSGPLTRPSVGDSVISRLIRISDRAKSNAEEVFNNIDEVWKTLNSKLRGHYQYYGINDNWPSLIKYQETAKRFAYRWICRRSQKGRISLREYGEYLKRNPLVGPSRLSDLIAKGRTLAAAMHR